MELRQDSGHKSIPHNTARYKAWRNLLEPHLVIRLVVAVNFPDE